MSSSTAVHSFPPFYACYLLRSLKARYTNRTYIGSTPNPARRLRQHNGELTSGARKTSRYRPWEMVAIVHGFPSQVAALQFEWAWQNPHLSRQMSRQDAQEQGVSASPSKRLRRTTPTSATKAASAAARRGPKLNVASQLSNLHKMLTLNAYRRWPLHVRVFHADVWTLWEKQCGLHSGRAAKTPSVPLPEWITAELDLTQTLPTLASSDVLSNDELPASQTAKRKKAKSKAASGTDDLPKQRTRGGVQNLDVLDFPMQQLATAQLQQLSHSAVCMSCATAIALPDAATQARILMCPKCNQPAHLHCLAKEFLTNESSPSNAWVPVVGACPSCQSSLVWSSLVKAAAFRKQMRQAGANSLAEIDESGLAVSEDDLSDTMSDAGSVSSMASMSSQRAAINTGKRPVRRRSRSPVSANDEDLSLIVEEAQTLPSKARRRRSPSPVRVTDLSGICHGRPSVVNSVEGVTTPSKKRRKRSPSPVQVTDLSGISPDRLGMVRSMERAQTPALKTRRKRSPTPAQIMDFSHAGPVVANPAEVAQTPATKTRRKRSPAAAPAHVTDLS